MWGSIALDEFTREKIGRPSAKSSAIGGTAISSGCTSSWSMGPGGIWMKKEVEAIAQKIRLHKNWSLFQRFWFVLVGGTAILGSQALGAFVSPISVRSSPRDYSRAIGLGILGGVVVLLPIYMIASFQVFVAAILIAVVGQLVLNRILKSGLSGRVRATAFGLTLGLLLTSFLVPTVGWSYYLVASVLVALVHAGLGLVPRWRPVKAPGDILSAILKRPTLTGFNKIPNGRMPGYRRNPRTAQRM